MWKSIVNAFKVEEVRKKLFYTLLMLVVIRFGSTLPIPGVNTAYFASLLNVVSDTDAFGWFNAMTGGSFTDLSIFALSITPYITSSIIIQLLTIAIPALERLSKEGDDGRKKIAEYTRYVTVALALIESTAMAIGFGGSGLLYDYNFWSALVCIISMTAGSALLMWIGECITEKGVGNGISIVLLFNILASLPDDLTSLVSTFIRGKSTAVAVVAAIIIIAVIIGMVMFTVLLEKAVRNIPVQYSRKMQGRHMVGGSSSVIPMKVNTAGVIPVIFASSLMSIPTIIAQFISGFGCLIYALKKNPYFRLTRSDLVPDRHIIWQAVRLGLPLAMQWSLIAVSTSALQRFVNGFGTAAMAAFTATNRVEQLIQQPFGSLSAGLSTYSAQNYGAGKYTRLKEGFRDSMLITAGLSLAALIAVQLFSNGIIRWFVNEADVIELGGEALRITSWFYIFLGTIYAARGILNGVGDILFSFINGFIEMLSRIFLPMIIVAVTTLGVWSIWWTAGLAWFFSALFCVLRYVFWKKKRAALLSGKSIPEKNLA